MLKSEIQYREGEFGVKEWGKAGPNCCNGCLFNCRNCYAKIGAKRYNRIENFSEWSIMKPKWEMLKKGFRKSKERIMFPTSHDIPMNEIPDEFKNKNYCDIITYYDFIEIILLKLLQAGNNLLITSKGTIGLVKNIYFYLKEYQDQIQFRFSIPTLNEKLREFWEESAPSIDERIKALEIANKYGFKTSISAEPFYDNPKELVEKVDPFVSESIWIGKMNHIRKSDLEPNEIINYNLLRQNYKDKNLLRIYNQLKTNPKIRWKDKTRKKLEKLTSNQKS